MKARWITIILFLIPFLFAKSYIYPKSAEKNTPSFYNEILKFSIEVKGISVGSILMRTVKTGDRFLQINTHVDTFDSMKGIYYIAGKFGAMWDFQKKKSYMAFEDIYDGYMYIRRAYRFQDDNRVFVSKREIHFEEAGLPHDGPKKSDSTNEYYIDTTDYQDLLGVFYTLRSSGVVPKPGEVYKLKILPAGTKKILVVKIIEIVEKDVEPLGGKTKLVHVKTGIANPDQKLSGGNIFFNVSSPLDMYFTADINAIPVKISAQVPIVQNVDVVLTGYKQKDLVSH